MVETAMARPLLSTQVVGRDRDVAAISALATRRHATLLFVVGEAGLGKTTLCRVVAEGLQADGVTVLMGQTLPHAAMLPFGPFLDAFRRFSQAHTTATPLDPAIDTALSYLLRLLPDSAPLFPDITPAAFESAGTPAQQQYSLFGHILLGLRALAKRSPLLLILEDMHWADATSLELLAFLVAQLDVNRESAEPILILATYRPENLNDSPDLTRLLVGLNAQRRLIEFRLMSLTAAEHLDLLNSILGHTVSPETAAQLYERDEGNPFYTEELLGAMVASGQLQQQNGQWLRQWGAMLNVPLSLKAAITERVAALPPSDQDALAYAAVIGRDFDFDLLATLCGLDELAVLALLRRAIKLQLITEVSHGPDAERYQFRHVLTRDAIYGEMLARERRLRHRAVAEAIERRAAETNTPPNARLLAEHYTLAGLHATARPYALHEAERARHLFAFREERYYLQMALTTLDEADPERLALTQRMGLLSLAVMDIPDAVKWLNAAKAGYQAAHQPRRAAQIMVHLTFLTWFYDSARFPALLDEIESTTNAIFADTDDAAQDMDALALYSQAASTCGASDQHTRARLWIERAQTLAARLSDPAAQGALTLSMLARGVTAADRGEDGATDIRQVAEVALHYNLPDLAILAYSLLLQVLVETGQSVAAAMVTQEINAYEGRSTSPPLANLKGWQRYFAGEWGSAVAELEQVIAHILVPTPNALYRATLAHILIARGSLDDAQQHLDLAIPILENIQYTYLVPALWGYAKIYTVRGDTTRATAMYERFFALWQTTEDTGTCLPILLDGCLFFTEHGNLWQSRRWLTALTEIAAATHNPVAVTARQEAEAMLRAAEDDIPGAIELLDAALVGWAALQRPYDHARSATHLAIFILAQPSSNRAQAEALLDAAATTYRALDVSSALAEIDAVRQSSQLAAQRKRRATLTENRRPFAGLTRREIQVLTALGAGLTNREIAVALHITEGTVELHVSHLLSKLDCTSRTQAATYAIEQGWITPAAPKI